MFFPKRIPEPKTMDREEMEVFSKHSTQSAHRWHIPLIDIIRQIPKKKIDLILDLACGPGQLTIDMATAFTDSIIHGIDISSDALKLAKIKSINSLNIKLKQGNAEHLPYKDNIFDVVVCKDSFHHFKNPQKVLDEIIRVTKIRGVFIIQDLRRDMPNYLLKQVIPPKSKFEKLQYYSARASYTKKEVGLMLNKFTKIRYHLSTPIITKKRAKRYKKLNIPNEEMRRSFQSRYIVIGSKIMV